MDSSPVDVAAAHVPDDRLGESDPNTGRGPEAERGGVDAAGERYPWHIRSRLHLAAFGLATKVL